jgi:NAD(P)-dependent dehydrogenase (short-subunit alcohol dehydrogenase family)
MVSWAVTGATRGIGFGFIDNLSSDPDNQVFALIRNLATADALKTLAAERKNVHIVVTDLSSPEKLKQAAEEISKTTEGSLDVLMLNAGSDAGETGTLPPLAL